MKILIGNSDVLAENIFVYQLLVEKVCTYLLSKNDDEKSRLKNGIKARNWAGDETALLSEILMDPMIDSIDPMMDSYKRLNPKL